MHTLDVFAEKDDKISELSIRTIVIGVIIFIISWCYYLSSNAIYQNYFAAALTLSIITAGTGAFYAIYSLFFLRPHIVWLEEKLNE
jgi:hypothetical protein